MRALGAALTVFLVAGCKSAAPPKLEAPAHVAATAGRGTVALTWDAVEGARGYHVYWATSAGVGLSSARLDAGSASGIAHEGLSGGTGYFYAVTAWRDGAESTLSAEVQAMPGLAVPAHVVADGELGAIRVGWDPVPGATSYRVYTSTTPAVDAPPGGGTEVATLTYLEAGLAEGATRYYAVTAVNAREETPASPASGATVPAVVSVGPLYPAHGAAWNDYVRNDGASVFAATDTACTGAEAGWVACLHGGEMRAADLPAEASCEGLAATDDRGALQWSCTPAAGGGVRIVSTGLQEGMLLSHLVDFDAAAFLPVSLRVRKQGATIAVSRPEIWWANPFGSADGGGSLAGAGTVNLASASPAAAIDLVRGSILLGMPGRTLVIPAGGEAVDRTAITQRMDAPFVWVEGGFAVSDTPGSFAKVGAFWGSWSVLRGVRAAAANGTALWLAGTNQTVSHSFATASSAALMVSGRYLTLRQVAAAQSAFGLYLSGARYVSATDVTAASCQSALEVARSNHCALASVTGVESTSGLALRGSTDALVSSAVLAGNYADLELYQAIQGAAATPSERNLFSDVALLDPSAFVAILRETSQNGFTGRLLLGPPARQCSVTGGQAAGLLDGICAAGNADGSSSYPGQLSDARATFGLSATSSFAGDIAVDDPVNASDQSGRAVYSTITDWTGFASPYRSWSRTEAALSSSAQGVCKAAEPCTIRDWSLRAADTVLRGGASPLGRLLLHRKLSLPSPPTASECDAMYRGSVPSGNDCVSLVLAGALERLGDGLGNEDGLCESGETCILAPNIGSYQGSGKLLDAGAFADGSFSVRLLRWEKNGE